MTAGKSHFLPINSAHGIGTIFLNRSYRARLGRSPGRVFPVVRTFPRAWVDVSGMSRVRERANKMIGFRACVSTEDALTAHSDSGNFIRGRTPNSIKGTHPPGPIQIHPLPIQSRHQRRGAVPAPRSPSSARVLKAVRPMPQREDIRQIPSAAGAFLFADRLLFAVDPWGVSVVPTSAPAMMRC